MSRESYFVLEDNVKSYLPLEWEIELPDFVADGYGANYPPENLLLEHYSVKAKEYKLVEDYRIEGNIASDAVLDICSGLGIPFVSSKLDIVLYRNKIPLKKYNYFYPKDRILLMDLSQSSFTFAQVVSKDGTCMEKSTDHFDVIERFVVKNDVSSKLFYCKEICKIVCSGAFKEEFERNQLTGIDFVPIDKTYRYDPWAGW